MSLIFYHIALFLYQAAVHLVAPFNTKARLWVEGRKGIWEKLRKAIGEKDKWIWMHCSSLGEFEQGRPVLEQLKKQYPGHRLLLSFFSPSGYEQRKNYPGADLVTYLPLDGPVNARRFLDLVKPEKVFFVKYDYWFYYLKGCHDRQIPLYIFSAIFRPAQPFFKWYGGLHRQMLGFFTRLFVQDKASLDLLEKHIPGLPVSIAGDTRFDRVAEIAERSVVPAIVQAFSEGHAMLVAGSTWPADEAVLSDALSHFPEIKCVIAPHEISDKHLTELEDLLPSTIRYSRYTEGTSARVLIIDNIGMLSSLYRVATVSYIGGGFGSGIHNTLEAAVYGVPVLFGPNYQRFREAVELVECRAGFVVKNKEEMKQVLDDLFNHEQARKVAAEQASAYVKMGRGATEQILGVVTEITTDDR